MYNKLWIDIGEQDNIMRNALWIKNNSSFAVLNDWKFLKDKKLWMEKAVEIWKSKKLTLSQMKWDDDFWHAYANYLKRNKNNPQNHIDLIELDPVWNNTEVSWWASVVEEQWSQWWETTEGW